ncbi:MAG: phage major capsid protein [Rubrivivax sp.]|nr:phage major capsid protein [Rubrivivax sp.]
MSKLSELREERARLVDQAAAVNAKYTDRPMPAAESDKLSSMLDRVDEIDRAIRREGTLANAAADTADAISVNGADVRIMRKAADFRAHYRKDVRNNDTSMSFTDFMRGVAGLPTTDGVRAALSEGTAADGGHLVPSVVMPQVLEALTPASTLLSAGAGILPLDMGAKTFTLAAIDTVPTAAWRLENGNVAESQPAFRACVAAPQSLSFYFKVSRELLADAQGMQDALVIAFAQAVAKELDRAGLRGTGTAPEPRGVSNTSGILSVTNGTNGAALAGYANFFTGLQSILQANGPLPSAAIMSPRSLVKLGGLTDSTGQPLRVPSMLEQLQLLASSQIPDTLTVGSSSDCSEIYLGDFTKLVFGMREKISIAKLDQAFATAGQVGFLCHVRADVLVTYPKAFALVTGVRP